MQENILISQDQPENNGVSVHENGAVKDSGSKIDLLQYLEEKIGSDTVSLEWFRTDDIELFHPTDSDTGGFICTQKINSIIRVNKFFEAANHCLQEGQYLVITLETKHQRKERLLQKFPKLVSYPYYSLDFVLKRVFPKMKLTRKIYFTITKGKNRVISLTEALGRLVSCGFEIVDHKQIGNLTYVISKKQRKPFFDMQPTYGAIVKLRRIGYEGEIFDVYKVRTMYPYSEYLQDYVYSLNNLEGGGKFKNDFRTTSYGEFFRRFWIDELPMLVNWLKGQIKLVGVRPLSEQYFYLYPKEIQNLRISSKPGLIPPYYADLPRGMDEILESEKRYLEAYKLNPIKTDIRYFFKAFKNIFITGARSK